MKQDVSASILTPPVIARLQAVRDGIRAHTTIPDQLVADLIRLIPPLSTIHQFGVFGPRLSKAWCSLSLIHGGQYLWTVNKLMMVELALTLPDRIRSLKLPPSVLACYPTAYKRMLDYIEEPSSPYERGADAFVKDLRLFSGLAVPAGTRIVDLNGHVGRRAAMTYLRREPSLNALTHLSPTHGLKPWATFHIDLRSMAGLGHLTDFNEASWDCCYRIMADLLRSQPRLLGLVGTSWFFDPALKEFGPYLSFLHERPVERGAILVRQRTTDYAIEAATQASAKRRKLVEQGKYKPCLYTLIWPRKALLEWAEKGG